MGRTFDAFVVAFFGTSIAVGSYLPISFPFPSYLIFAQRQDIAA
ncbi:unnamed protein product [Rotaria sp. Silwood1]|nr:unnamed protein product [Rotaria sp. Silwood1]